MLVGVKAGLFYFAMVFAAGFALGAVRTLMLGFFPQISRLVAVLFEVPLILVVAWLAAGYLIMLFQLPPDYGVRLAMGLSAFTLLMIGEAALSIGLNARSFAAHLELYLEPSYQVGLAGQILFALFPLLRLRRLTD